MIIDGVMLLWFLLTALSVAFVAIDIQSTPESPVMKWGFVLLTAYAGPFGAFLYVLGCREPLPGLHERYVAVRWRQALGSTMHCVAGDGIGILAGAVIGAWVALARPADVTLEYILGFGFGWTIFQALFMLDMSGGNYARSLRSTFLPELLSMNCLMGGMIPVSTLAWGGVAAAHHDPMQPLFWFRMSCALMTGFVVALPINWWLVANRLKHGMMTVRRGKSVEMAMDKATMDRAATDHATTEHAGHTTTTTHALRPPLPAMTALSFLVLAIGVVIAWAFGGL